MIRLMVIEAETMPADFRSPGSSSVPPTTALRPVTLFVIDSSLRRGADPRHCMISAAWSSVAKLVPGSWADALPAATPQLKASGKSSPL